MSGAMVPSGPSARPRECLGEQVDPPHQAARCTPATDLLAFMSSAG